jgi:general secretion pathway protein J
LIDRKVRDRYGDEQNQFILADKVMTFTRTGWANLLQQKRSQLQRVSYRLEDDKLLREYWLELDQGYEEQKVQQPLLSDVENFEVKLITPGEDKLDTWPPDTEEPNAARPLAIEVNLEIKGFGLVTRIFEVTDVF